MLHSLRQIFNVLKNDLLEKNACLRMVGVSDGIRKEEPPSQ
jgi:hypothetical protein